MYEGSQKSATPKAMPETSEIISLINNKLVSLTDLLSPVININRGLEAVSEKPMGSSLVIELRSIEDKISYLLDRIHI